MSSILSQINKERWFQITSDYFVTGVRSNGGQIDKVSPIVGWMMGWSVGAVFKYCDKKQWDIYELDID